MGTGGWGLGELGLDLGRGLCCSIQLTLLTFRFWGPDKGVGTGWGQGGGGCSIQLTLLISRPLGFGVGTTGWGQGGDRGVG